MPGLEAERPRATDIGRQVRRYALRLLEVVARDADQARLERFGIEPVLDRTQLV